jgi:hypothetical protein
VREWLAAVTQAGLDMMDDLAVDITYWSMGQQSYDPATGEQNRDETAYTGLRGIFTNFSFTEVDGSNVQVKDMKLIIKGDLPVEPNFGDRIQAPDGYWEVVNMRGPPSRPCWILQVRAP